MAEIIRAGQPNSLGHIDTTQGDFRTQIDALTDTVRQMGGNPNVPGDPLTAPFQLYVNGVTGSDKFVAGDYTAEDDGTYDAKMRRISLQRLECGYSAARPFKTINRAVIEAGIITSRDYLNLSPAPCGDLVSINVATGQNIVLNDNGAATTEAWTDGQEPTDEQLIAFNPQAVGGVILPRGCSLVSLDLRKTILRPNVVPASADEAADYNNRRSIFLMTGGGYYYGFTFMDQLNANSSHHLLSTFAFASKDQLDEFYAKIRSSFSAIAGLNDDYTVPRKSEYQIVGATPVNPDSTVDTVKGSSPYIYNISLRSEFGLCGLFADGAQTEGFDSCVLAQYTGVSLQKDISCFQRWVPANGGQWETIPDYVAYINTDPNNLRPATRRRSFHIRAVNNAVIQEVSVFAIGQSIHHLAEAGGEITITNSNSNFGHCALLSEGFKDTAQAFDTPFVTRFIKRARDPFDKPANIRKIYLGLLVDNQGNEATTLELQQDLVESRFITGQPEVLSEANYSLKKGDYIWVENTGGDDYRAKLTETPWEPSAANSINIQSRVETDKGNNPEDSDIATENTSYQNLAGARVYVRRLQDPRTVEERRNILIINHAGFERMPLPDYVIQPTPDRGYSYASNRISSVYGAQNSDAILNGFAVELRYNERPKDETKYKNDVFYHQGDVVRQGGKHYAAVRNVYGAGTAEFNADDWTENYVHMEEDYAPEGTFRNAQPLIIFDGDTDGNQVSKTLGFALNDDVVVAQYCSGVDYVGLYQFLINEGRSVAQATADLKPQNDENRQTATAGEWSVEFRRPSQCRTYGHAYEWSGWSNYSKALPQYQKGLLPGNKFSYYFTNQGGGKCYVTGFNEEGFRVSNSGLEVIETGQMIDRNQIGAPDQQIDFPETFDNLTIEAGGTLTISDVNVIGLQTGRTDRVGGGKIASATALRTLETPGGLDGDINQAFDDQGANFVTPEGLNYWKSFNNLLSSRPGTVTIWVVPNRSEIGDSVNFNGSIAVLSADPSRSGTALGAVPPDSPATAVHIRNAIDYGNSISSPLESCQYKLANGPYWGTRLPAFGHKATVIGATDQFKDEDVVTVANYESGGTPTTNVFAIQNNRPANLQNWTAPIFATGAFLKDSFGGTNRINLVAEPVQLVFNYGGRIQGCFWLGANETFLDTTNFPNKIINAQGSEVLTGIFRSSPTMDLAAERNGTKSFVNGADDAMAKNPNAGLLRFDRFFGRTTMALGDGDIDVYDCVFGAKAANWGDTGYGETGPIVRPKNDCRIRFAGIYFIGNVSASTTTWQGATTAGVTLLEEKVTGRLHCGNLVDGYTATAKSMKVAVQFTVTTSWNVSGSNQDRNNNRNCIHILNSQGNYGTVANQDNDSLSGATFKELLGALPSGSQLFTGGYRSYMRAFLTNPATGHHGFAGRPGQLNATDKCAGVAVKPQLEFNRFNAYSDSLWQMASNGEEVTWDDAHDTVPGNGQRSPAYTDPGTPNPLNIQSQIWEVGVDVTTGNQNSKRIYG